MTRSPRLLLLILALCLPGCSLLGWQRPLDAPDVRLVNIEKVKTRWLSQHFILHMRLTNPNARTLPVRQVRYSLRLEDITLAEGSERTWFSVPPHGSRTYQVEVRTSLWQHLKPLARLLKQRGGAPLDYTLTVHLRTGFIFGQHLTAHRTDAIIGRQLNPE